MPKVKALGATVLVLGFGLAALGPINAAPAAKKATNREAAVQKCLAEAKQGPDMRDRYHQYTACMTAAGHRP